MSRVKIKYAMTSGLYNAKRMPIVMAHRQLVIGTNGSMPTGRNFTTDALFAVNPTAQRMIGLSTDLSNFSYYDVDNYTNGFSNFTYTYRPTVLTVVVRVSSMTYDPHLSWAIGVLQPIGFSDSVNYWLKSVNDLVNTGQAKMFSATDMGKENVHLAMVQCFPAYTMPYPSVLWNYSGDYNTEHIVFAINSTGGASQVTVAIDCYLCAEASIVDCQIFDTKFWIKNMSKEEYTSWARIYASLIHVFNSDEAVSSPVYPFETTITPALCIDYMDESIMKRSSSQLDIKKHDNLMTRKGTVLQIVPYKGGWFSNGYG